MDAEGANRQQYSELDIAELQDDPDLEAIYADRLASMQKEAEKRAKKVRQGFGELSEIKVQTSGPPGCHWTERLAWESWACAQLAASDNAAMHVDSDRQVEFLGSCTVSLSADCAGGVASVTLACALLCLMPDTLLPLRQQCASLPISSCMLPGDDGSCSASPAAALLHHAPLTSQAR